ncbi:MAG TPA: tRNA lysidine(34) synthetase TilS [Bacteroidales bacterium]|nr:tRNA lysidine(34) synthetase TilS [Bacteroidales bacterium]
MHQRFLDYLHSNQLCGSADTILLGVSGGIDSMVMLHLFLRAGFRVGIAHCNYRLRAGESDCDEAFVRQVARDHQLPFHVQHFDTRDFADEKGLSLQMAARRLRYSWFDKLRDRHGYQAIAIGHNKNDQAETFLINLSRGTGLKGLTGMKQKNGPYIRPLLFASRAEIEAYSREQGVAFREDSSNQSVKYSRNKIRHQVIPVFHELNPRFLDTMMENIDRLKDIDTIYRMAIDETKDRLVKRQGSEVYISKDIKDLKAHETFLFEILKEYGFAGDVICSVARGVDGAPGKSFYSPSHKLVRDREWLILTPLADESQEPHYIEEGQEKVDHPVKLQLKSVDSFNYDIPREPDIASIDRAKVSFPLMLRKWQQGDCFKPLGLDHFKKLSDFFVDRKYSLVDKQRVWLLTSGGKIVWILGDRMDERFKVDEHTQDILEISYTRQ